MIKLAGLFAIFLSTAAAAACNGTDLRRGMDPQAAQHIATLVKATPYATGNHWTATKGSRRIDVIGTMHLNATGMEGAAQVFEPLIARADVVLLESTPSELQTLEKRLSRDMSLILLTEGPTLIDLMPPAQWEALSDILRQRGMPPWMASKMRPWFLTVALSIPPCIRNAPELKRGMDMRLSEFATQFGTPQKSLEDPLEALQRFERFTLQEQIDMMMASPDALLSGEDAFTTLIAMYFEGRSFEAMQVVNADFARKSAMDQDDMRAFFDLWRTTFLDERNALWLPVILNERAERLVVAVGAGHLPGETGLLRLLERAGFAITPGQS